MKDTRRSRMIRSLKELILTSPSGVSRGEAASALGIDLRTASGYLEDLTAEGLLRIEKAVSCNKGRPGKIYRSNADNLCFAGVRISSTLDVQTTVIDSLGRELKKFSIQLPEDCSRLSSFNSILDQVKQCQQLEGKMLFGIGLAISRWLQPPLAGEDVYANLSEYLNRESGVAVYRDVIINMEAFAQARMLNCRNLALVHAGKVMEFGLIADGVPDKDFARRENWLSHICVNPDGRRCYCGKYGCLENYLTIGARKEILSSGKSAAAIRLLGERLGMAMVRLVRKFPVEAVVLLDGEDVFFPAEEYFSKHAPGNITFIRRSNLPSAHSAAALVAAYFELYRYTGGK